MLWSAQFASPPSLWRLVVGGWLTLATAGFGGELRSEVLAAVSAGELAGVTVLKRDLTESAVRKRLAQAEPQSVFVVEPGASWVLTGTLRIPDEVTVLGFASGRGDSFTFKKGFNGTLASVGSWTTLQGLLFDGNKAEFEGDGLVDPNGNGIREQRWTRVEVRNCRGDGFVLSVPHYYSVYEHCTFDHNNGYGLVYGEVRSHHTDNLWNSCHFSYNGKGGVAFHGVEASSVWENCELFHNGGAAFEQFRIHKKLGDGQPIGPTSFGADDLVIRNSVIRNHAGPVWLNRAGDSEAIVFQDCRLKHNVAPEACSFTKGSGKTAAQLLGLTEPVGLFHAEGGRLSLELRGGNAWDNGTYLYTATAGTTPEGRFLVTGSGRVGHFEGGVHAPNALLTVLDVSLLPVEAPLNVKSGIGLDPRTGSVIRYGPAPPAATPQP